jgi:hypothetical protein
MVLALDAPTDAVYGELRASEAAGLLAQMICSSLRMRLRWATPQ